MKTLAISLCVILLCSSKTAGQANNTANNVIEGGKVMVELIKAFSGKKDSEKTAGCKGTYADLCVNNESSNSMTVLLQQAKTEVRREMVILPGMKECSLQIPVGVWTYDLHLPSATQSLRKGDILIEGCQNLIMNIK
ncbi:MAG: hypothetical protein ABJB16_02625 [Saprospiraceae bacterium]